MAVTQLRGDIAPGRAELRVTNGSDAAVSFGILTLTSSAFAAPVDTGDDEVALAPGRTVDLRIALPPLVCTNGTATARVSGEYEVGSGPDAFEADADDTLDVLSRLAAGQCDVDAIARVADIRAISVEPRVDGSADLEVAVTPSGEGGGALTLVALDGTTLLRFASGEQAPLGVDVAADDAPSTLSIAVVPRRCDPHALGEDKVGTLFGLDVDLGGRTAEITLPRSQEVADALLEYVGAACGLSG